MYKKRKPLVQLEESAAKVTNKFCKDVQARNLELSVQACLWLCRKNQTASAESEEREAVNQSEDRLFRTSKEVARSKTSALAFSKPKGQGRFERKKTTDLRLRRTYANKESSPSTRKKSSEGSDSGSEDQELSKRKAQAKVKKTGRGRPPTTRPEDVKEKKRATTRKVKSQIKLRSKKYK